MAEVFLAKQSGMEGFEKPVVVKRILPQLTSDQTFVDMFINEARVAARLSHPAIVQIFDSSIQTSAACQADLDRTGVSMLIAGDTDLVWERLFGKRQVRAPID